MFSKSSQSLSVLALAIAMSSPLALAASHDVEIRSNRFLTGLASLDISRDIPIDHTTCGQLITGVSANVRNLDARNDGSLDLVFDGRTVDHNYVIGELGNHYQDLNLGPITPKPLCNRVTRVELRNSGPTTLHIKTIVVHIEDPAPQPALAPLAR